MKQFIKLLWALAIAVMLAACDETTADVALMLSPEARDTAIVAQLERDADATGTSRAATRQADVANIAGTYEAATAIAEQNNVTATAISQAATDEAYRRATETQVAAIVATQAFDAGRTATAVQEIGATGTAQIIQTQTAILLTAQEAEARRKQREADLMGVARFVVGAIGVGVLIIAAVVALRIWRKRSSVITHGPFGVPLLLLEGPRGQQIILDPLRLFAPAVTIDGNGQILAPQLAAPDYQENTTARAQAVALAQAQHSPHKPVSPPALIDHERTLKIGPWQQSTHTKPAIPAELLPARANNNGHNQIATPEHREELAAPTLPADAPWRLLDSWRGGTLPIGLGTQGLLATDPNLQPHFMISGTTGSGKTFLLRTIVACALADNWQVIIVSLPKPGLDLFETHPNAYIRWLDEREPERVIEYVAIANDERARRDRLMLQSHAADWTQLAPAGRPPRVLMVIDELSNLAEDMEAKERKALWTEIRMLAREGRKAGLCVALALQDPTAQYTDIGLRRLCVPIALRLADQDVSRAAIGTGGAERLAPRHFLVVLGDLREGVTLTADDANVSGFLAARPVTALPPPVWLESECPKAEEPDEIAQLAQTIERAYHAGASKRSMARAADGEYAGAFAAKIDAAILLLQGAATAESTG